MFPYSASNNAAVRSQMDSQFAYFNDVNSALAGSFKAVCVANLKLGQTIIEECMSAGQRMMSSERAFDIISVAAACAQPASDKLRAYQQHLSRLAADGQVDLARVSEQHGPATARTAHALAEEVTRTASEETARSMRQREKVLKKFRDPFLPTDAQRGNGHTGDRPASSTDHASASTGAGASMQFDGLVENGSVPGHVQGPSVQPAGNKLPRKPR